MSYKQIKVNLTQADYEKIKQLSIENEISMAHYVRESLNANMPNPRKRNINIEHKKVIYHLLKVGNNLNQIAKALNTISNLENHDNSSLDKKVYEDIHLCKIYLHNLSMRLI